MKINLKQMDERLYDRKQVFELEQENLRKIKRAEKLAWFFFIGLGISYITLTLIIQYQ